LAAGLLAACVDEPLVSPGNTPAARPPLSFSRATTRPDRYLVSFTGAEPSAFAASVQSLGGTVERRLRDLNLAVVRGVGATGAAALAKSGGVELVAQDLAVQFIPAPDPSLVQQRVLTSSRARIPGTDQSGAFFFDEQWNMRVISADKAWSRTAGGRGAVVCILDTGIDPDHIDMAGKVDPNLLASFISEPVFPGDLDPLDYNFHGTASAGYISSNGIGVVSS